FTTSGDRRSSVDYAINGRASGTYYYRVRAYAGGSTGYSEWSNVVSVNVTQPSSTIKITNNLSGTGSNKVLQLRVASTEAGARSDSNELLSPDNTCVYLGPEDISPGQWRTYDVPSGLAASGYYVFMGLGIWDGSLCSNSYFEKKMWTTDANFNLLYIYQIAVLQPSITDGKDVELVLDYDGNNLAIFAYSNNVYQGVIPFAVVYSDPTTSP
ncbi:MAG: hypothetical protein ACK2TV_11530, partial [Anaerolineales bacterium]